MNANLESFFDLLKFAPRQRTAFLDFFSIIGGFFKNFSFKSVTATITLLAELLGCVLFAAPRGSAPHGDTEQKLVQTVSGFLGKQMEE